MKYYKWTLEKDVTFTIPQRFPLSNFSNEWVAIIDNAITVRTGYSWDGCSPKIKIFGLIIGTWDGIKKNDKQELYYPSLIHDALCQWKVGDRLVTDQIFLWMMHETRFIFRHLYYFAVRCYSIVTSKSRTFFV